MRPVVEHGCSTIELQDQMAAGAARNALDCALHDLAAKSARTPIAKLLGIQAPLPLTTCFTISVDTPEAMAEATRKAASRPLLKVKLAGDGDAERLAAVREAAPNADLVVDANEAWREPMLATYLDASVKAKVLLIEQPLPAGADAALLGLASPIPICADESVHDRTTLDRLIGCYQAINIKLDKTGGLTEAVAMLKAAKERDFKVMAGCMVGTSLAMAPAMLIAASSDFVDLDGPLLLAHDREPGLRYEGSTVFPPDNALWG
jgi:L-Ala-D/L-Glu epimerase